jgi:thiamine biosynthesis lipoprotein
MNRTFRAMGTQIEVLADDDTDPIVFEAAAASVARIFEREESRFSRFREDSELSRVNRSAGSWVEVSDPFADVVAMAIRGAERTGGLFDPTVLQALEAAGYDRDFASVDGHDDRARLAPVPCGGWERIELRDARVRLPSGVGLDLGGLVKGWTADLATEAVVAAGLPWAIVNAGGDLRMAGEAPPQEIGIEDPDDRREVLCVVRIDGGAFATTSVTQRRWGKGQHHLIDPRIGLPAATPVVQATVWASTCAEAEVSSKRAALQGLDALEELSAVLVLATGEIVTNLMKGVAA